MRPGICRTYSMRVAMKPKYGPPDDSGTPSGWPSPTAMSAPRRPHSPGRLEQCERGRVDDRDHENAALVRPVGERIHILEPAEEVRLLDDESGQVLARRTCASEAGSVTPSSVP